MRLRYINFGEIDYNRGFASWELANNIKSDDIIVISWQPNKSFMACFNNLKIEDFFNDKNLNDIQRMKLDINCFFSWKSNKNPIIYVFYPVINNDKLSAVILSNILIQLSLCFRNAGIKSFVRGNSLFFHSDKLNKKIRFVDIGYKKFDNFHGYVILITLFSEKNIYENIYKGDEQFIDKGQDFGISEEKENIDISICDDFVNKLCEKINVKKYEDNLSFIEYFSLNKLVSQKTTDRWKFYGDNQ